MNAIAENEARAEQTSNIPEWKSSKPAFGHITEREYEMNDDPTILNHQNTAWALRQLMGWPMHKPANDRILFSTGLMIGEREILHLAQMSQHQRKDVIYAHYGSLRASRPAGYAVAFREMERVDVIGGCVPYAADASAPVVLVSTLTDETFYINARGSLERRPGKPKHMGKGRRCADRRIRAAAATMGDQVHPNTFLAPWGRPDVGCRQTETAGPRHAV